MVCENCKVGFTLSYKRRPNFRKKPTAKQFCKKECWLQWLKKDKQLNVPKNNDIQSSVLPTEETNITTEKPENNPEILTGHDGLRTGN